MRRLISARPLVALAAAFVAGVLAVALVSLVAASVVGARQPMATLPTAEPPESIGAGTGTSPPEASSAPAGAPVDPAVCSAATTTVSDAEQLTAALGRARPGDSIHLQPGTYGGRFVATESGTAEAPIELCGPTDAVLDGEDWEDGYVLHLDGATHWRLVGFTVRNGQKGVMADGTVGSEIRGLTVHTIGDEAIHLRRFSTDNLVTGNTIHDTGLRKPKFGEGVYVGTAESNWCDISDCRPDASDRNEVTDNTISRTTSESVDIKEGTRDGVLRNNRFDGADIVEADSWVDVKGNDWVIQGNRGENSPLDGFQTHEILDGYGTGNRFSGNTAAVNGPGLGFAFRPVLENQVSCDNEVTGAGEGFANIDCT